MSISYTGSYKKGDIKKVVLAYSGGLDTSVILKWLQTTYGCEVVTYTADLGQGEELGPARKKAEMLGIKSKNIFIDDVREEFVRDFVFPMFRANALYEGQYLLGTSIARPLIAKRQIEIARKTGADAVSHGATGKGNDQVRFELGAYALMPNVKIIAPWREWDLLSREKLMRYADQHGIPVDGAKRKGPAPYSMDANLLHISYEGGILEDPNYAPDDSMWRLTVSPEKAPNKPQVIELTYQKGDVVAIDGKRMSPAAVLTHLNIVHSVMHYEVAMALTPDERSMLAVPASHVTGLVAIILAMVRVGGCTLVLREFKAPAFLAFAAREGMTHTLVVPAIYNSELVKKNAQHLDDAVSRIVNIIKQLTNLVVKNKPPFARVGLKPVGRLPECVVAGRMITTGSTRPVGRTTCSTTCPECCFS